MAIRHVDVEPEILIHITASSTAADDQKYRSFTQAYLNFEPVGRIDLSAGLRSQPSQTGKYSSSVGIDFPSPSFRSASHNRDSPQLLAAAPQLGPRDDFNSQALFESLPSVVEDSLPRNDVAIPGYSSPTRLLEHFLNSEAVPSSSQEVLRQTSTSQGSSLSPALKQSNGKFFGRTSPILGSEKVLPTPLLLQRRQRGIESVSDITIPATQTPRTATNPTRKRKIGDVGGGSQPRAPVGAILNKPEASQHEEVRREGIYPSQDHHHGLKSTSAEGNVILETQAMDTDDEYASDDNSNVLEIVSPEPLLSTAILTPSDLITPKLANLLTTMREGRIEPKDTFREIRPLERGYWLIDTTIWSRKLKRNSWEFLKEYFARGDAGWGIWATRDPSKTWLRVYCFGVVVPHIYLLLYVASSRMLKRTSATWHDSLGDPVMTVRPRKIVHIKVRPSRFTEENGPG
jgi:hypothetical protein